jgi:hypothetical protein
MKATLVLGRQLSWPTGQLTAATQVHISHLIARTPALIKSDERRGCAGERGETEEACGQEHDGDAQRDG